MIPGVRGNGRGKIIRNQRIASEVQRRPQTCDLTDIAAGIETKIEIGVLIGIEIEELFPCSRAMVETVTSPFRIRDLDGRAAGIRSGRGIEICGIVPPRTAVPLREECIRIDGVRLRECHGKKGEQKEQGAKQNRRHWRTRYSDWVHQNIVCTLGVTLYDDMVHRKRESGHERNER